MALIEWSDDLSVEIAEIDEQHKKLISLINQLQKAMKAGQGKQVLTDVLGQLSDYVGVHFGTEEKYMQAFKYAGYLSHKKEHTDFQRKIAQFGQDFAKGSTSISVDLFNFLNSWLINHIKVIDKKYTAVFKENIKS
jgi:hemerythrin